jgi:hypothetical protein
METHAHNACQLCEMWTWHCEEKGGCARWKSCINRAKAIHSIKQGSKRLFGQGALARSKDFTEKERRERVI